MFAGRAPGLQHTPTAASPDAPEGGVLPGCDPVNPQSTARGFTTCTSTQTCQVDCAPPMNAPPRNECIAGGSRRGRAPSATATPTACPARSASTTRHTGCNVKVCLRFCNGTADCATFGAGGGGPGSVCEGPVMCPAFLTAYHTCTFNCDPRAMAAASGGGCPTGLTCLIPGAMDQVDCACAGTTRTKREGEACTSAADCLPGFICNQMTGTKTCRPICRCDANASGTCTATAPTTARPPAPPATRSRTTRPTASACSSGSAANASAAGPPAMNGFLKNNSRRPRLRRGATSSGWRAAPRRRLWRRR